VTSYSTLTLDRRGPVAELRLNRPDRGNPIDARFLDELDASTAELHDDASVHAVLLTAAGDIFSHGSDRTTDGTNPARGFATEWLPFRCLELLAQPVIACIEGDAIGAGLGLALACDVRIAASNARLGAVFHKIGLTSDFGMSWLLSRAVGPGRAMDLLMSAEIVDGTRAEAIGLVSRVCAPEQVASEGHAYARRLADGPPVAMALTKGGLHRALERELAEMLAWEADAQATCSKSDDVQEGLRAFGEKRKPEFRGR
jgi:2-(1,2-epoxy-1,2-dihydrophenyl)acetyl-CoA isomerase